MEFKSRIAVKDVSINIPEGEIVRLLGPSGASNTTTFKMIREKYYPIPEKYF